MLNLPQGVYLRIIQCNNKCKLTEVFLSKHCQSQPAGDLPNYKVSQKLRSIMKSSQEIQPVIDLHCSECELSNKQRNQWKTLQRLSGDSSEMKHRLVLLLIVPLRERISSFFLFLFNCQDSCDFLCVFVVSDFLVMLFSITNS